MLESIRSTMKNRKASVMGQQQLFRSAVLLPLVEQNGELCVLFEERAHHLNRQPGEICFPGGRIDPTDEHELAAAIRETCEELGLEREAVEPLGPLDYIVNSFQIIYPFVGWITDFAKIRPNLDEVASVFCVPLSYLRNTTPDLHYVDLRVTPPDDFPFDRIPHGRNYKWRSGKIPEYFYFYGDRVIWGLTARILHHFLLVTQEERRVDGAPFVHIRESNPNCPKTALCTRKQGSKQFFGGEPS
ncbi:NUDIX hydrolase [Effusibacillus pohliae]|uniref:NUDIX hydrolase n=1 Tax=Effusibacillus pohliae TaxID=232270 RepID=UPI0003606FA9|nr:CoA pyrophosphatase [Effusibacillus pohliae]